MAKVPNQNLMKRVEHAVFSVLDREGRLTYSTLLIELGHLSPKDYEAWRRGHVPCLERVLHANLTKLARIQTAVRRLAKTHGLARFVHPRPNGLRYSKTGHPLVEQEYHAIYRPAPAKDPA
jgi:hypothetical protein